MTGKEIIAKVKDLNLPEGSYVVFGSCPLALAGIRESNDIDLLVNSAVSNRLKSAGWKQISKGPKDKPFVKDDFEAHSNWNFSSYKPTLTKLLKTATIIENIPFASLDEVRKWKESSGRSKDLKDIKLIDKYYSLPTITICSSASFYRQAVDVQAQLQKLDYRVIIPATAEKMKHSGDFNVQHYKTWFGNKNDYHKKTALMRGHFDEVKKGDAILVLNYEKHDIKNYIGGNALMEMALAFFLHKPIFILNEIPENSNFLEEIIGLNPVLLHGKVEALPREYENVLTT
jgi:hypothetical protein